MDDSVVPVPVAVRIPLAGVVRRDNVSSVLVLVSITDDITVVSSAQLVAPAVTVQ